jgi:PAS domain S-box-containing protein
MPTSPAPLADLFGPDALLAVLEVSSVPIHVVRPVFAADDVTIVDFALEYLSPAGQRLVGLPERPGGTVRAHCPQVLAAGLLAYYQRAFEAGDAQPYEVDYQAEGLAKHLRFVARRSSDCLVVSFTDTGTPPRPPAELALREALAETERQRAQLERLFMEAPTAICILGGPTLVHELVNPGYQALFPERALLGCPLLAVLPELGKNQVYQTFLQVYETGRPYEEQALRIPMARPTDGVLEDRYFRFIQQARTDAAGQVDGVLVFAFEITEQVRARQQAEEGERWLRLLTDALPVLISYVDHTYTYRFVNQAYQAWFHQDLATIVGRTPRELVGEAAYARVAANLTRALAGERVEFEATIPYRPDFVRHVHGSFVPDVQDGRVRGFFSLLSDVSEQVEARHAAEASARQAQALADALGLANEQLTRSNVDLDNFIYTASHDLRAPITNIEGLVLALRRQLQAPATQPAALVPQLLDMMQGAVERFQTTIAQLTDVARLQQAHNPPTEEVAVAEAVEAVRLDLLPQLTQAHAQLRVEVPADLHVSFAPKNLRSVVYNLLSNAIKYQHPDRRPAIRLQAARTDGAVELTVQDNGLGLSEQQQSQLFGLFRRLHTHVEGTGVGLYMVKRIVENAGGTITVRSQSGVGTTFSIRLPQ